MNCAIIIQTCDKYEPFWSGFFHFMHKQWDFEIDCPIYFCNENKDLKLPNKIKQIKTQKGTFVQNLKKILSEVKEDNIFYMLEDFWPIAPMKKDLFNSLYGCFLENDFDALQVGPYTPYYELEPSNLMVRNEKLLKFKSKSNWIFNFQARFWKKNVFEKCLREPKISEEIVSSAITVESESDNFAKTINLNCYLHHYFWYPISGVAYRGNATDIGREMINIMNIDNYVKNNFN